MRTLLTAFMLLIAVPVSADWLGCFEPSATVSGASAQFTGTATTVTANVMDPNDTTTPTAEPTMSAVGSGATNLWRAADFSVGASPLYGVWVVQYEGTVNSATAWGSDLFEVRATCPVKPSVAGATIVAGNLDASVTSRMATYTQPTGFLAATFPTTVASPTNITAATGITVATNNDKTGYTTTAADQLATITQVSGTADSGSTTTIVDAERTEADADYWANQCVMPTSGTISGQGRRVSAFNATTDTLTVDTAWTQAVTTNTYIILRSALCPATSAVVNLDTATGTLSNAQIDDDVVVGSVTGAVGSVTNDVGGKVLGGGAGTITGTGARVVDGSGNAVAPASATTAIQAKTDQLTFTVANEINANTRLWAGTAVATPTTAGVPEVAVAPDGLRGDAYYMTTTISAESATSITLAGTPDPITADNQVNGWLVQAYDATTREAIYGATALVTASVAATNVLTTLTDISALTAINQYVALSPVYANVTAYYTGLSPADALVAVNLDHLVGTATGIPAVVSGTYLDQMMDDGTAVYDRTTDSLQAIRDRGDAAWTGTNGLTAADIWSYGSRQLTGFSTGLALSIWDVLESSATTTDSMGLKLKTMRR